MSALKKPEIKLTAADRRKVAKAMALVAEVLAERFGAASAQEMGPTGFRRWEHLAVAKAELSSALRY
jgi:hypothetical protein